jgi:CRISPR-associated endonuclease/helicase Cas3
VSAQTNANLLRESFMYNWLINPVQKTDADSDETNLWKSRDIDATETVFVSTPESVYYNKLSFQSWKISNSVELPLYLVKKGEKNFRVDYKLH